MQPFQPEASTTATLTTVLGVWKRAFASVLIVIHMDAALTPDALPGHHSVITAGRTILSALDVPPTLARLRTAMLAVLDQADALLRDECAGAAIDWLSSPICDLLEDMRIVQVELYRLEFTTLAD